MDALNASRQPERRSRTLFSSIRPIQVGDEHDLTSSTSGRRSTGTQILTYQPNTLSEASLQIEEIDSAMIVSDDLCDDCLSVQNQRTDAAAATDKGDGSLEMDSNDEDTIFETAITPAIESQPAPSSSTSTRTSFADLTKTDYYDEIIQNLRDVFKHSAFHEKQLEAITATMCGLDVFLVLPAGAGKSLCFQLPAVCKSGKTKGVTVVVSPLIALMKEQARVLGAREVDVVLLTSDHSSTDISNLAKDILSGERKPSLVYVTPEKLQASFALRKLLMSLYDMGELARFAIDEAHCVTTWGRNFREAVSHPSFQFIAFLDIECCGLYSSTVVSVV